MQPSPVTKRNPRPRKYASAADRQAAYRARNEMLEFRAEAATAKTINAIANTLDTSRSDLLLSMVKFALTNHDWARFGLTHKTIPFYQGNPTMATKEKRVFMMSLGEGTPKIPQFYDFAFTHYIPMNSHGGSSVAFKFVAHNDEFGNLVISEPESGKKFGGITYYAKAKLGRTDKALAKLVIEDTLQRVGATRVYEVLTKGRT